MSNLNARTDPNADPMVAKEAAADKPSPFRLKPGVFFHAPRLLFKVLRHDPARWQREERSFRNRIKLFKHRTAQAGSLSDKELARLAEDIVDLFRTCLHDGAMYYGLGLVWMYWRTARLLRKRSNAGGELTENVAAYFLQLLLTDQKNPLSPLFEQFRKLSADTQEVDLQAFVVSIPDSAFMTANTSRDIEKAIFKKLRALPKGQQIETQVDALLADLPVAPEAVDWPFSPRPQLPFRLLVALLSSEPIEGLDELLTDEDAAKQVAKKLPFRKRPPWRWNVAKTRGLMAGAVGTVFLLLEIIPVLQRALSEVAQRLLRRRGPDAPAVRRYPQGPGGPGGPAGPRPGEPSRAHQETDRPPPRPATRGQRDQDAAGGQQRNTRLAGRAHIRTLMGRTRIPGSGRGNPRFLCPS